MTLFYTSKWHRCFLNAVPLMLMLLIMPGLSFAHGEQAHGNHDAKYGGLVMMYLDLHFEVVLGTTGGVELYFSDSSRTELPAAVVSDVQVTLLRGNAAPENVMMSVSASGDAWAGESTEVKNPEAIIKVAFVFQGEALVFELPARLFPALMKPMHGDMSKSHA